jgi:hypothetical protein
MDKLLPADAALFRCCCAPTDLCSSHTQPPRMSARKSSTRQSSTASAATQPDEEMATVAEARTHRRKGAAVKQEQAAASSSSSDNESNGSAEAASASRPAASSSSASIHLFQQAALPLPPSSIMQNHNAAGVGGMRLSPPTGIARYTTAPTAGQGGNPGVVTAPTPFARQISRQPSTGVFAGEWRASVAVEERINIRRKLREAYFKHCPTYEQLLDVVTAVDEELLFSCSANRIDYFKSSIDWDGRIALKRQQLKNATTTAAAASSNGSAAASPNGTGALTKKRSRGEEDLTAGSVSLFEVPINNSDLLPRANSGSNTSSMIIPPVSALAQPQTGKRPKKDA